MEKNKLFLLKPDFEDPAQPGTRYVCPESVFVEGLLSFYPRLRESMEVVYVDFVRPRRDIIRLLGDENQSCPVLILKDAPSEELREDLAFEVHGDLFFLNGQEDIAAYFSRFFKTGQLH